MACFFVYCRSNQRFLLHCTQFQPDNSRSMECIIYHSVNNSCSWAWFKFNLILFLKEFCCARSNIFKVLYLLDRGACHILKQCIKINNIYESITNYKYCIYIDSLAEVSLETGNMQQAKQSFMEFITSQSLWFWDDFNTKHFQNNLTYSSTAESCKKQSFGSRLIL